MRSLTAFKVSSSHQVTRHLGKQVVGADGSKTPLEPETAMPGGLRQLLTRKKTTKSHPSLSSCYTSMSQVLALNRKPGKRSQHDLCFLPIFFLVLSPIPAHPQPESQRDTQESGASFGADFRHSGKTKFPLRGQITIWLSFIGPSPGFPLEMVPGVWRLPALPLD